MKEINGYKIVDSAIDVCTGSGCAFVSKKGSCNNRVGTECESNKIYKKIKPKRLRDAKGRFVSKKKAEEIKESLREPKQPKKTYKFKCAPGDVDFDRIVRETLEDDGESVGFIVCTPGYKNVVYLRDIFMKKFNPKDGILICSDNIWSGWGIVHIEYPSLRYYYIDDTKIEQTLKEIKAAKKFLADKAKKAKKDDKIEVKVINL
jgi:hypothetical protein